ncbi:sigma-70 family RNA polymerase sigma factor [Paenibacillus sp. CAU 1523]|uniref:Sigma-70 family RNA polymerase sigma factor n=1 Tax=Paenibacillus arenosi TaxID=2774142 RepID=A0ABR9B072_9BACL|nr:sigma-70 family RNA polymerase sigma factor [Paenibacillus arenosi]MBD8498860.1 sigma-70 family RNA polymerase sigma factor [Paenibacillus arenosi]
MGSIKYRQLRKDKVPDMHNVELIEACKSDSDLLGEFLKQNREFIFSIIARFKGSIEEIKYKFNVREEELLQHAYIGIMYALKSYDPRRGIKFTTFVARPIVWEINQLLYNDSHTVRLSRGAVELIKKMGEIEDSLGYRPSKEVMAEMLNVPNERFHEIMRFTVDLQSCETDEEFDMVDEGSKHMEEKVTNRIYVQQLLEDPIFTDFEKEVMRLMMTDENNTQIAGRLGVYPMTINRTLTRIRSKIEKKNESRKTKKEEHKVISKYDNEIKLIAEEMVEKGEPLCVEDVTDLLDMCGYDLSNYTSRVIYYIRQKALKDLTA